MGWYKSIPNKPSHKTYPDSNFSLLIMIVCVYTIKKANPSLEIHQYSCSIIFFSVYSFLLEIQILDIVCLKLKKIYMWRENIIFFVSLNHWALEDYYLLKLFHIIQVLLMDKTFYYWYFACSLWNYLNVALNKLRQSILFSYHL